MTCEQPTTCERPTLRRDRAARLLLCVGDSAAAAQLAQGLQGAGWDVQRAADVAAAETAMAARQFTVGLLVQPACEEPALAALDTFLGRRNGLEWVGVFNAEDFDQAGCRELIITRLFDHHTLPSDLPRLTDCLGHAHGRALLRQPADSIVATVEDAAILGNSAALAELLRKVGRVAAADATALICGESGTGKELVAQALHRRSRRAAAPFVALNCGAIPAALIQSELFGHEKGAFTGATEARCGYFERASGGTIFLDEVADLPLALQVNLLRFLQEGTINRVGSAKELRLDVRVVAATHVDLEEAVACGRFRRDLYYRLNVLPLRVPSLRERRDDIALLAQHFFGQFAADNKAGLKGFSQQALRALQDHRWPGNVRELMNRVRCAVLTGQGRLITPADLGLEAPCAAVVNILDDARWNAERKAIHSSLEQSGRKVAVAARQLGVSRMTLYRLMAKHGLSEAA